MYSVNIARLLLQIAVILALCRLLHGILKRMGQPPVIGEIIAGLLLGPPSSDGLRRRGMRNSFQPAACPR